MCAPEALGCLQGLWLQDLPLLGLRSLLGRCSDTEDGNLLIGPVAEEMLRKELLIVFLGFLGIDFFLTQ